MIDSRASRAPTSPPETGASMLCTPCCRRPRRSRRPARARWWSCRPACCPASSRPAPRFGPASPRARRPESRRSKTRRPRPAATACGRVGPACPLGQQRLGPLRRAIEHGDGEAGGQQMAAHAGAHHAGADPADLGLAGSDCGMAMADLSDRSVEAVRTSFGDCAASARRCQCQRSSLRPLPAISGGRRISFSTIACRRLSGLASTIAQDRLPSMWPRPSALRPWCLRLAYCEVSVRRPSLWPKRLLKMLLALGIRRASCPRVMLDARAANSRVSKCRLTAAATASPVGCCQSAHAGCGRRRLRSRARQRCLDGGRRAAPLSSLRCGRFFQELLDLGRQRLGRSGSAAPARRPAGFAVGRRPGPLDDRRHFSAAAEQDS